MSEPMVISVGSQRLSKAQVEDADPRGIVWTWEGPQAGETYVLGVDTAVGITGWDRTLRTSDDIKKDNAVVQVLRVGRRNQPDAQVAEYAAPIDHYELAMIINFLGRMYAGDNEDGQALACIEMNNGGWATHETLVNRYGYLNMPIWTQIGKGLTARPTQNYGWYSNRSTRRDLWVKGMRHINGNLVLPNSPWLVEEMVDCTWDNFLSMTARGAYGSHDDRVVALLIAIWYAHEWSMELDPPEDDKLTIDGLPEAQRTDATYEEMNDDWNERMSRLID
jgi:hypothetical protein